MVDSCSASAVVVELASVAGCSTFLSEKNVHCYFPLKAYQDPSALVDRRGDVVHVRVALHGLTKLLLKEWIVGSDYFDGVWYGSNLAFGMVPV